jgi:hypothetical protein
VVRRKKEKKEQKTERNRQSKGQPGLWQPGAPDTNSGCVQAPSGEPGHLVSRDPLRQCRYRDHGKFERQTKGKRRVVGVRGRLWQESWLYP